MKAEQFRKLNERKLNTRISQQFSDCRISSKTDFTEFFILYTNFGEAYGGSFVYPNKRDTCIKTRLVVAMTTLINILFFIKFMSIPPLIISYN